jgi:hypothetical protein
MSFLTRNGIRNKILKQGHHAVNALLSVYRVAIAKSMSDPWNTSASIFEQLLRETDCIFLSLQWKSSHNEDSHTYFLCNCDCSSGSYSVCFGGWRMEVFQGMLTDHCSWTVSASGVVINNVINFFLLTSSRVWQVFFWLSSETITISLIRILIRIDR